MRRGEKDNPIKSNYLEECDIPLEKFRIEPFTMVVFGGAGDLSQRKLLPTIYHLFVEGELPKDFSLIGFGLTEMSDRKYRDLIKEGVKKYRGEEFNDKKWKEFQKHLYYLSSPFEKDNNYKKLREKIKKIGIPVSKGNIEIIYYMAVPPKATPIIVERLKNHGMCKEIFNTKIIVEKPFGWDRKSAVELNNILLGAFEENQIFRIDHYLAKETVQNILFFRFSNSIFEPIWNSRNIDNVQITAVESIGVGHRGKYYEQAGVVRDMVQNHILQLVALVAMEVPVGLEADYIRDEKAKIFHSIRKMNEGHIDNFTVRGQYGSGSIDGKKAIGYREEKDIDENSNTPTFIAAKLFIDNWRWAKVPFYIRTGKRLSKKITEICIQFKQPPLRLFGRTCEPLEPNVLILSIQPKERISLKFGVKYPKEYNKIYPVYMDFSYQDEFKMKPHPPYERLLIDSMKGDLTLFIRQDSIKTMWEIVDPITGRWESNPPKDFPNYRAGTWGPEESSLLMQKEGRKWITR